LLSAGVEIAKINQKGIITLKPESPVKSEKRPGLTVTQVDLEKRYDVYHCVQNEERLYENVKFVGLRSLDERSGFGSTIGAYLELETLYGSRMLISNYGVHLICEHGTKPAFKVFRSWLKET
jgi:hypothetical protein